MEHELSAPRADFERTLDPLRTLASACVPFSPPCAVCVREAAAAPCLMWRFLCSRRPGEQRPSVLPAPVGQPREEGTERTRRGMTYVEEECGRVSAPEASCCSAQRTNHPQLGCRTTTNGGEQATEAAQRMGDTGASKGHTARSTPLFIATARSSDLPRASSPNLKSCRCGQLNCGTSKRGS